MTVTPIETGTPTVNSRWRVDVQIAGEWTQVRGMSSFTPALNPTLQDATDYDNDGWGADAVTQRKWQLQMTVFRKVYGAAYDPGQEALRAAADQNVQVPVRWYERGGTTGAEAYAGSALVQWEPQGGDPVGLGSVNVNLLGQGIRNVIEVPTTPATPPE